MMTNIGTAVGDLLSSQISKTVDCENMSRAFKGTFMKPAPKRNPTHFGEIPGFPVGSRWPGRRQLCDDGVHAPLSAGIHGRSTEGAFSIVLSGGYEDDVDLGYEFTYTGQGGQGPREVGTKWGNVQIKDQEWSRGNLALALSWRQKFPVRVIRGHTLDSPYAPAEGYRYDGLYLVEDVNMKKGKSGFDVCLFRFVRCPNQLPLPGPVATLPLRQENAYHMTWSPASASSRTKPLKSTSKIAAGNTASKSTELTKLTSKTSQFQSNF